MQDPSHPIRRVSVLGLGRMGSGIAHQLAEAGFELTVWNRSSERARNFVDSHKGAVTLASTPSEAAANADAVVTMLMDDASVMEAVTGADGILESLPAGSVHVCTTTVSPHCSEVLTDLHAEAGSDYLAAPVLGRPDMAAAGQLRAFVSGHSAVVDRAGELLSTFTTQTISAGTSPGAANVLKLCANYALATWIELAGEVYTIAEKYHVPADSAQWILDLLGDSPPLTGYSERIKERQFDSELGSAMTTGLKDMELILGMGSEQNVPLPLADPIRQKMLTALAHGLDDADWSAISLVTRAQGGLDGLPPTR